jgi:hypothetical protein
MLVLVPSLGLLFGLVLRGRLDAGSAAEPVARARRRAGPGPLGAVALACLVAGVPLTVLAEGGWMLAIGVAALLGFVATGFVRLAADGDGEEAGGGDTHET